MSKRALDEARAIYGDEDIARAMYHQRTIGALPQTAETRRRHNAAVAESGHIMDSIPPGAARWSPESIRQRAATRLYWPEEALAGVDEATLAEVGRLRASMGVVVA